MSEVKTQMLGSIYEVVLSRPPLNTLNEKVLKSLTRVFEEAKPKGARMLLLRAEGEVFSHGMDPEYFLKADNEGRYALFWELMRCCLGAMQCTLPIVVDLHGEAIAGGAVLAAMGDYVAADAKKGKLCFSEIKVNLPVPSPIIKMVSRRIEPRYLNDLFLLGRNFDVEGLKQMGFANFVYNSTAERDKFIQDFAGRMERLNPDVVAESLISLRSDAILEFLDFEESFDDSVSKYLSDKYLGAGLKAALQKQKGP